MKHCPLCKINYADDTLAYCLEDGTPLVVLSDSGAPTVAFQPEDETVLRRSEPAPTQVSVPPTQNWQPQQSEVTQFTPQFQTPPHAQPKKSNTALAILVTALVMLFLFGGGLGAWLLLKDSGAANNTNKRATPTVSPTASNGNANSNVTPTPSNSNSNSNTNTNTSNFDENRARSEVENRMSAWRSSMESGSLDSVMGNYAGTLDYYYGSGRTSAGTVRNDKSRAFQKYDSFHVRTTNMNISFNSAGDVATVTFLKTWVFDGASVDRYVGSARAKFQVSKVGGYWLITGEKDQ